MFKYLIYLVNMSFFLLFFLHVLIGYFSCKEMLLFYVDLEFSHLENTLISSATFLVSQFSVILCDWNHWLSAVYSEHRHPCHVSDFSGISSKV